MLIHAIDAPLQDRKIAFDRVRMGVAPDIFVGRMDDGAMAGELLADFPIDTAFISAEVRIGRERIGNVRRSR
jgi:hypothetical protein